MARCVNGQKERGAILALGKLRENLTRQQIRSLRGQILSGEIDSAMRGMEHLRLKCEREQSKAGDEYEPEGSVLQV